MTVVGITGPSGVGKSLFCSFLAELGCLVLDCDLIYHDLVNAPSDCTRALAADPDFGERVIRPDGSLNRRAMAHIVFAPGSEDLLCKLNRITHAFVLDEVRKKLSAAEGLYPAAIVDAPLLYQSGFDRDCDLTLALIASPELRMARLKERDALSDDDLKARLSAAPEDSYYRERADVVIINEGDMQKLELAAKSFFEEYCRK